MTCENCIHANVCVIRAFPEAFENTQWEKVPCDHFKDKNDTHGSVYRIPVIDMDDTERLKRFLVSKDQEGGEVG